MREDTPGDKLFNISMGDALFAVWGMKVKQSVTLLSGHCSGRECTCKRCWIATASCVPVYAKWMVRQEGQSTFVKKEIQAHGISASTFETGRSL